MSSIILLDISLAIWKSYEQALRLVSYLLLEFLTKLVWSSIFIIIGLKYFYVINLLKRLLSRNYKI